MKTIAYYITDSGFGHLTRSTAIIKEILDNSDYNVLIVCNHNQNEHAKVGLRQYEDRLIFVDMQTDANSVFVKNSLQVDVEATEENILEYMRHLPGHVRNQANLLKAMDIQLVITDISILGIMVAKRIGAKCIGISNYTWYNRYKTMGIHDHVIDVYKEWYNQLDLLYRFELSDAMDGIECPTENVGLVCREPNQDSVTDMNKVYWPAVYMSVGQVEKKKESFKINFPSGTIFATGNIQVEGTAHLVKLPARVAQSQDFIAASSFALIKGGWSSVAECLIMDVPFGILIQDDTEDEELVEKLFEKGYAFKTTEEELRNFEITDMNIKSRSCIRPSYENDARNIALKMIEQVSSNNSGSSKKTIKA